LIQWKRLLEDGGFLNIYLDPQDLDTFDFEKMLKLLQQEGKHTKVYEELL
jgi:hypothetical protein